MTAAELLLYLANQADIAAVGRFTSSKHAARTIIIISCAIELRPQREEEQQQEKQQSKARRTKRQSRMSEICVVKSI